MADELPYWNNAWNPFDWLSNSENIKKPKKLTMANVLADIPEYEETADHDRNPVESVNANRSLSQKRLNESIGDVMDRVSARTDSPAVQFSLGVHNPLARRSIPTGGYYNPNLPIPIEGQNTNARLAGTAFSAVAPLAGPPGQLANLIRSGAGAYNRYQADLDKQRLNYASGGPIIPGFNAKDIGTGSSSSIGFTPPEAQRSAETRAAMENALQKRDAVKEAIDNAVTYGEHPDYYNAVTYGEHPDYY